MILGIGIDVIEVERVQKAASKEAFLRRVFTEAERVFFARMNADPQVIAGTFAAKEAVSKALGTGLAQGVEFKNIEISRQNGGAPAVKLTGGAAARLTEMGGGRVHISISHIKAIAVAQAVVEDG